MPKRNDNLISKQNKLIATRLIQISLLVDDYLYQQKPMTQDSAAAYIKEISGYKEKCYRDVRSLQVIEKLTRCMKGIINEQQDLQGQYAVDDNFVLPFQDVNNTDAMLSPVYSIVDEDLTQCIDIDDHLILAEKMQDKEPDSNKIETRVTINPFSTTIEERGTDLNKKVTGYFNIRTEIKEIEIEKQAARDPLTTDMEVINLCDEEIDELKSQNNACKFHHVPDINIQNSISNLSIKDIEETFTPFSQQCSQSILDDYHPGYSTACTANLVHKDVKVPLTIDYDAFISTANIARQKPATELISKDIILPKIVLPTTKRKMPTGIKLAAVHNINRHKEQNSLKDSESVKASKPETKKRNNARNKKDNRISKQSDTKTTNTVKTNNDTSKVANKKQTNKQNIKASDTKQKQNEAIRNTNTDTTQKQNKHSEHQNQAYKTEKQLTYSKTQISTEPTQNKYSNADIKGKDSQTVPIYNTSVVNDLSWIENIRFVREIPSEEYESFTEGEVFWENYTLPEHWDADDFNY